MTLTSIFSLLKSTFQQWNEDKASRLGAALAYYSIFSLAPLLLVAIAVAGIFLGGQDSARIYITNILSGVIGSDAARQIGQMIQGAHKQSNGVIASVIGIIVLLLGASGVFGQLQDALNTIWKVELKPNQGILTTVKARFFSLLMVFGTGFLLLVSLLLTSILKAVVNSVGNILPIAGSLQLITFVVSFVIITLLFAMIYKVLPDVKIHWRDVWIGAVITSLLFLIGQIALSWYLGTQSTQSVYGAAGSLVVLLLYIYYSAQIVFFGAEFTQVYANKYGSHIEPAANAILLTGDNEEKPLVKKVEESKVPMAVPVPRNRDGLPEVISILIGFALVLLLQKWRCDS